MSIRGILSALPKAVLSPLDFWLSIRYATATMDSTSHCWYWLIPYNFRSPELCAIATNASFCHYKSQASMLDSGCCIATPSPRTPSTMQYNTTSPHQPTKFLSIQLHQPTKFLSIQLHQLIILRQPPSRLSSNHDMVLSHSQRHGHKQNQNQRHYITSHPILAFRYPNPKPNSMPLSTHFNRHALQ